MSRFSQSSFLWFSLSAVVLLSVGVLLTWLLWDWLHPGASATVSNSETLRNVGFLIGGALAFVFALWRGWAAVQQANAARSQVGTAQHQAETAQQGLLNERYQRGAEMLGHNVVAVRMGGIYALQRLAEDHPEEYHVQIMRLFCAFVRFPGNETWIELHSESCEEQDEQTLRPDVQDVMSAIGSRSAAGISLELSERDSNLYLREVDPENWTAG